MATKCRHRQNFCLKRVLSKRVWRCNVQVVQVVQVVVKKRKLYEKEIDLGGVAASNRCSPHRCNVVKNINRAETLISNS